MQHPDNRPWQYLAGFFAIGLLLSGFAHGGKMETAGMKTIVGSVWYRERMLLPPKAEIRITLDEVARADANADLIATTHIAPQGGPPWAFALEYDPAKLHDKGRYVLRARIEAEGRLLFTSTEHIPAFDRTPDVPLKIMVSRVAGPHAGGGTPAPQSVASLTNTYWKLIELNGQPAALGAGQRDLHLILNSEGNRVHGFSGCNRFTGTYQRSDDQLRFGQLASTRKACVEGMEQEKRFLDALGSIVRFTLSGESLEFYGAQDQLILRFESVYLK